MKKLFLLLMLVVGVVSADKTGEKTRRRWFGRSELKVLPSRNSGIPVSSVTTAIIDDEKPIDAGEFLSIMPFGSSSSTSSSQDNQSTESDEMGMSLAESSGAGSKTVQDLLNNNLISVTQNGMLSLEGHSLTSLEGLGNVPGIENVVSLYLGRNKLWNIPAYAFAKARNLRELWLNNNNLISIDREAFKGLDQLYVLVLDDNELSDLEPGLFNGLTNLREFSFVNNPMSENEIERVKQEVRMTGEVQIFVPESIEKRTGGLKRFMSILQNPQVLGSFVTKPGDFSVQDLIDLGAVPELVNGVLDLSGKEIARLDGLGNIPGIESVRSIKLSGNKISSVPAYAFAALTNLEVLDLSDNQISHIALRAFVGLKNLRVLNLRKNELTRIQLWHFKSLPLLRSLWLDKNQLAAISPGSFYGLRSLVLLDLSNNELQTLSEGAFKMSSESNETLKMINLDENRISSVEQAKIEGYAAKWVPRAEVFMNDQRVEQVDTFLSED